MDPISHAMHRESHASPLSRGIAARVGVDPEGVAVAALFALGVLATAGALAACWSSGVATGGGHTQAKRTPRPRSSSRSTSAKATTANFDVS